MSRLNVKRKYLRFFPAKFILIGMFTVLFMVTSDLNRTRNRSKPLLNEQKYDAVITVRNDTGQGQNKVQGRIAKPMAAPEVLLDTDKCKSCNAVTSGSEHFLRPSNVTMTFSDQLQLVELRAPAKFAHWNFSYLVNSPAIEQFNVTLPPLLRYYQNPCWLEYLPPNHVYQTSFYYRHDCMEHAAVKRSFAWSYNTNYERRRKSQYYRVRCFPYFFVLGVSKSGTTDLYYSVTRYFKHVISGARKEPHFWNRRRIGLMNAGSCHNEAGHRATISDYLDLYDEAAEKIRLRITRINKIRYHKVVTGDFTPSLLTSSPGWKGYAGNGGRSEPLYTIAHHLYGLKPDARLIIILRDPVERAFSQMRYRHLPQDGQVAALFHSLVINTISDLHQCSNIRACVYNSVDSGSSNSAGSDIVIPGMYAIFVRDWLKVFPRDQFMSIRFEDYTKDRVAQLDKISTFLDIDTLNAEARYALRTRNVTNAGMKTEEMWPRTRAILQDFYRPWNSKLSEILSKDYTWGY